METTVNVKLLAHTQLADNFLQDILVNIGGVDETHAKLLSLSAIRTCYSHNKPSEVIKKESSRYLNKVASDGSEGKEIDRLIRMIVNSGHTSTLEHATFSFSIEGVSRALLGQITRHRFFSFSVQSQRYVKFGSDSKSGGFDYVIPDTVSKNPEAYQLFVATMESLQTLYDELRELKIPAEDARALLPMASACNFTMTTNLRALLDFYSKRKKGRGAQLEIAVLADELKDKVVEVEPWTAPFFEQA